MLKTSEDLRVARIPVDSQQTSFEQNRQFKFFDDVSIGGTDGDQLVYKVTAVNPFVLFYRLLGLYDGGCTYRVYADDGSHTFTGTLADAGRISPVNTDLTVSGLPSHPVTTIGLQSAAGNGIFVPGSKPLTGTSGRTSNFGFTTAGALAGEDVRLGFAYGLSAWVVLTKLDAVTGATAGELELYFEERFPE